MGLCCNPAYPNVLQTTFIITNCGIIRIKFRSEVNTNRCKLQTIHKTAIMINDATTDPTEPLLDPKIDYTYDESVCSSTDLSDATVHRMRCNYVTTAAVFVLVVGAGEMTR